MKTQTPAVQRLLARARGNIKPGRSKPIAVCLAGGKEWKLCEQISCHKSASQQAQARVARLYPIAVPGLDQSAELREKGDKAFEAVVRKRVKELGEQVKP